jgi:GT2 family glycosyltransferase/glycosyltransferase involved in cell wall biosynthesis
MWQALYPARKVGASMPRGLRNTLRRGLKAAWWGVTPWRIPERLAARRATPAISSPPPAAPAPSPEPFNEEASAQVSAAAVPERPVAIDSDSDRFRLDLISPLQGDYRPAIAWYDPTRPEVSIIVLNWNGGDMTLLCLEYLWQNTSNHRYEIIVVDNGSAPEDVERLREQAPLARIIPLGVNLFFGEANNIGVEAARGRYVCLLNNDAFVSPGWLAPLVEILKSNPKAGAVGPCFRYPDGSLQEAGALVNPDGSIIQLGKGGRGDDSFFGATRTVDYISAACILLRRDDFLQVLGFDFAWDPAYYEDVDLCLKLRLFGLQTIYCPRSAVVHIENATSANQGASLKLHNVVSVNRAKFAARWGRYLETMGAEKPNLLADRHTSILHAPVRAADDYDKHVLIYTPFPLTPGGGERYILTMAEAFKGFAGIALLTAHPISRTRLLTIGREFGLDVHHVETLGLSDLSARPPFDLAFVLGNELFPSVGRLGLRNIFICQFPFPMDDEDDDEAYRRHVRPFWSEFDLVLTYSEYVRTHVSRQAAAEDLPFRRIEVLTPPVPLMTGEYEKHPGQILHVGRFFTGGHCKRQDAMIEAFRALIATGVKAELHFAGSTKPEPEHQAYYLNLIEQARDLPVFFHPNCSGEELSRLYGESVVYWHATGVGGDIAAAPHTAEHFGISVVEAMSARCIPIVFAAGGPATIVDDGVTGFHFQTLEQLAARTRQVLEEIPPATLGAIAAAAETAARGYGEVTFKAKVRDISFGLMSAWEDARSTSDKREPVAADP